MSEGRRLDQPVENLPPQAANYQRAGTPTPNMRRVSSPSAMTPQRRSQRLAPSVLVEGTDVMRSIDRPLPGDTLGRQRSQVDSELNRKKSAFFESQFAASNRVEDPAMARVRNEAMVIVEVKTNVIITNESGFVTDLAYFMSSRYQRPLSSISVSLQHSLCMLYGGTLEHACTVAIAAVPSLVQPATNRRNAACTHRFIAEALRIAPARIYIRFEATPEENVSIGGRTLAAEAEELARGQVVPKATIFRKPSNSARGLMKTVKSLGSFRSHSIVDLADNVPTPPPSNSEEPARIATIMEVPATPTDDDQSGHAEEEKFRSSKVVPRRKNLRSLFGHKPSTAD